MRTRTVLASLIVCFCLHVGHAAVTVGTCQSAKHPYTTISEGIAAVAAGGVVNVCPGVYAEQLEIDKPITVQGIVVANQPGVTIIPPSSGLNSLPAGSGFYPQIFVNSAGGAVHLSNLSVNANGALINMVGYSSPPSYLCVGGELEDFSGVYVLNTEVILDHLNVANQFASILSGGDESPIIIPNCGNGIEVQNSNGIGGSVQDSVVSNVGYHGIIASGSVNVSHNVVTGGAGARGVGISAGLGNVTDNMVTSSLYFIETQGIQGGSVVRGNTVQSGIYGIEGAEKVLHNTLLNNAISISGVTQASDNLIDAPATYANPECPSSEPCNNPTPPTVGIDLACADASLVRDNGIVGVGIGIANLESGQSLSVTNLFANVGTTSTSCSQ